MLCVWLSSTLITIYNVNRLGSIPVVLITCTTTFLILLRMPSSTSLTVLMLAYMVATYFTSPIGWSMYTTVCVSILFIHFTYFNIRCFSIRDYVDATLISTILKRHVYLHKYFCDIFHYFSWASFLFWLTCILAIVFNYISWIVIYFDNYFQIEYVRSNEFNLIQQNIQSRVTSRNMRVHYHFIINIAISLFNKQIKWECTLSKFEIITFQQDSNTRMQWYSKDIPTFLGSGNTNMLTVLT